MGWLRGVLEARWRSRWAIWGSFEQCWMRSGDLRPSRGRCGLSWTPEHHGSPSVSDPREGLLGGDGTFSEGEGDIGRTCPLSHVRPGGSRGVHSMSRSAARALPRASRPLSGIFPFPLPAPHVGGVHILSWQVLMCSRTDPPLALSLPGPRAELHPIPSFTIYIPSSSSSAAVASLA